MMHLPVKRVIAGAWLLAASLGAGTATAQDGEAEAVLSLGGSVTEIVYALGEQGRLIGRDTTSSYPPEAEELTDVGYLRALSPEGVLSVAPDLILAEPDAGPPEAINVLKAADVAFVEIPGGFDADAVARKIRAVGAALDVPDKAETLAVEVTDKIAAARDRAGSAATDPKRVLFVLSAQGGKLMAGGEGTAADAVIRMAGGINALSGVQGYKPLTDEAAAAAAPEVVLMMDRGDHSASAEELFALPALAVTPAAETGALVKMDGLKLLGFGPRTADAVTELSRALYGE